MKIDRTEAFIAESGEEFKVTVLVNDSDTVIKSPTKHLHSSITIEKRNGQECQIVFEIALTNEQIDEAIENIKKNPDKYEFS